MSRTACRILFPLLMVAIVTPQDVFAASAPTKTDGAAHLETYTSPGGTTDFALSLSPQTGLSPAKACEVAILVETSASQNGPYREKQLEVLQGILSTLADDDHVKLVAVDDSAVALTDSFVSPRGAQIDMALEKFAAVFLWVPPTWMPH